MGAGHTIVALGWLFGNRSAHIFVLNLHNTLYGLSGKAVEFVVMFLWDSVFDR